MTSVNFIIKQIKCDIHNIQEYIKILPKCKKTRYNLVQNNIKILIKEIRYQKRSKKVKKEIMVMKTITTVKSLNKL